MRSFEITVQNAIGDECVVKMEVREDRSPNQYSGPAILKAKRVLPDERPFKVISLVEA